MRKRSWVVSPLSCDKWSSVDGIQRVVVKEPDKDEDHDHEQEENETEWYGIEGWESSPIDAKVEDASTAHNEAVGLVVGKGRGSRVIDAHDDILDPQSSLVSNAALGHLTLKHMDMFRSRCECLDIARFRCGYGNVAIE